MSTKIYTKNGDRGETALVTGTRVKKDHPRLEAYGCLDELNSTLGCVTSHLSSPKSTNESIAKLFEQLLSVQSLIFALGSQLANDDAQFRKKLPDIESSDIFEIEKYIDQMESELPPLKNFILPGGHPSAAFLQLARTTCRRAERLMLKLQEVEELDSTYFSFINRLSDYFFVAARFCNQQFQCEETLWKTK